MVEPDTTRVRLISVHFRVCSWSIVSGSATFLHGSMATGTSMWSSRPWSKSLISFKRGDSKQYWFPLLFRIAFGAKQCLHHIVLLLLPVLERGDHLAIVHLAMVVDGISQVIRCRCGYWLIRDIIDVVKWILVCLHTHTHGGLAWWVEDVVRILLTPSSSGWSCLLRVAEPIWGSFFMELLRWLDASIPLTEEILSWKSTPRHVACTCRPSVWRGHEVIEPRI